ncbi:MAG TPA: UTP--glucose-1-phosphate uridylyltransferase GalU [Thiobacillaceae bacterium]|nr:UTP--glucose-1-phosphate uridylyltransferase GalU [Thiobacillaceae bacterium]HNA82468.1 UTP--glucose-1-phosphate uridylyltransferase GalU [Thiobacillaceae bacterium]HNF88792.1 UTP--glucose-1-phosphate uridylyltransferase GalU [Thiobacillaceae bacterium]HNH88010.1 UTP--glucose-1-phosphate uridylyltransferase GalU [Thiobacillaceae bacterium]HNI07421.1 UTP--glucose-1-phosphate uridylyltransferase GalU [Thiobacillaceae bacterium]
MQKVTKAVFPVAGMGTRFLPATKANPKEMLPIVDKPLIQYAVEEAVAAGITDLIFINGRNKRAIPDHFDKAYELETELEAKGKKQLLDIVRGIIPDHVNCIYIRQAEALGLGHAVLCAEPAVNREPFAVLLADDLIDAVPGVTAQMVDRFSYFNCSLVGVQNVARDETDQYGIVVSEAMDERLSRITGMVEKPAPDIAPSTLGVVGRYVFTPRIFEHLRHIGRGTGGEIQLTDGIVSLLSEQQVLAYRYEGTRYDCGSKLGYLQATVEFALKHPELAEDFATWLDGLQGRRTAGGQGK